MSQPQPSQRVAWIDNLRTLMIVLVVNMHACVTYSHIGSWYRMESPEPATPVKIAFFFWECPIQAFFMGLLFFLAGIFAHHSLERRGPAAFLRGRAVRLGLPSLFFMLFIQPFILYVQLRPPLGPDRPTLPFLLERYLTTKRVLYGSGPMWFAIALLFFCVVLAGVYALKPAKLAGASQQKGAPTGVALLGFAALLAVSTFLIRLWQPMGTNVYNFQLCFFPQYIAAFIVGVVAGRQGWLEALATSRRARIAGWLGIVGGPVVMALIALIGKPPAEHSPNLYAGGLNVRAFAYAAWEQLTGFGIALGLIAWFYRRLNSAGRMATWLSDRAFAVYVLHPPVLVALTPLLRPVAINPFVGAALLTVTGLVASFGVADVARRVPGLRSML
jgi:fucose 4-O-acetylase-like acetyltransferase